MLDILTALAINEAIVKPILKNPINENCPIYTYKTIHQTSKVENIPCDSFIMFLMFELPFIYMQPVYLGISLACVMKGSFWLLIPSVISFFGTIFCYLWLLFVFREKQ